MKKISLVSLMFVAAVSVKAQDRPIGTSSTPTLRTPMAVTPRFGIKGGANIANLIVKKVPSPEEYKTNSKTSFYGGFFVNIPLSEMIRFQPELLYSSQGSKVVNKYLGGTDTYEQDLGYIALPLMVQYQAMGFFAEVGPQLSFLVTDKRNNATSARPELDFDRIDVGGAAGLGYLSRVGLGVNARYNFGLANIIDDGGSKDGLEIKNSVIQVGLVYHFGANK